MDLDVVKSSRHSKITGDFAEALVVYWLSKYNFECFRVDHTGIDVIACNKDTHELLGISVKSRSRSTGKENTHLRIGNDDFEKVKVACKRFRCVPWFALVIDAANAITGYLLSMEHLLRIHPKGDTSCSWSMRPKWLERYASDPAIMRFVFTTVTARWWGPG